MQSAQVSTAPLVRNFAIVMPDARIQVCTKLGSITLVRADFPSTSYPTDDELQRSFLTSLMAQANPQALGILNGVAAACIKGQQQAIQKVMTPQLASE